MTVSRISTPHAYVGVSGDTKPTDGVPPGSSFIERDSGHEFIFDGSDWAQKFYPHTSGEGGGVSYDADTLAYFAAMSTEPSAEQKAIYDYFFTEMKRLGLKDKVTDCGFLCAHDAQSAKLGCYGTINLSNIGTGPTHYPGYGMKGNGTSQALDTGYKIPLANQNDTSMAFYVLSPEVENSGAMGNSNCVIIPRYSAGIANTAYLKINTATAVPATADTVTNSVGLIFGNRTGSTTNDSQLYQRDTEIVATGNVSETPDATYDIWMCGRNQASPTYSTKLLSFWHIGTGFTAQEIADYSDLVERVIAALSASYRAIDNVTDETIALYRYMILMGRRPEYLLGVFNNSWWAPGETPNAFDDIVSITGKYPAFTTENFAHPNSSGGAAAQAAMVSRLNTHYAAGGICILHQAPGNPGTGVGDLSDRNTGGTGSYRDVSQGDLTVTRCLEGGIYHAAFNAYLDELIDFFALLDGPIIYKPMHERNANSTWMNRGTTADKAALHQHIVEYMTAAGVNNVLFDFDQAGASALIGGLDGAYYDFCSLTLYDNDAGTSAGLNENEFTIAFANLLAAQPAKPLFISEIGFLTVGDTQANLWNVAVGDRHASDYHRSAGFTSWRSTWGPTDGAATNADVDALYDRSKAISRDEVSGAYTKAF